MDSDDPFPSEESFVNSADLLDGLLRVSQIVRLRFNDWLGLFELNDGRHAVLVVLSSEQDGGCSQARLAERLGQSESNISTLIERMQRDGLVSRSKSDADRRKRILRMTSAGRAVLASVNANRTAWAGRLLNGFRSDERVMLLDLLNRLGRSIDPTYQISVIAPKPLIETFESVLDRRIDPHDDPQSPQFALRQMLQALSSFGGVDPGEKDAA